MTRLPLDNLDPEPAYPPPYDFQDFAERLEAARMARGWSREDLARAAFVDVESIRSYELARRGPRLDTLVLLSDALGVSLDWLTGRRGHPLKPE